MVKLYLLDDEAANEYLISVLIVPSLQVPLNARCYD
jgi:hypothetical protein